LKIIYLLPNGKGAIVFAFGVAKTSFGNVLNKMWFFPKEKTTF
jgi:hypothetical protein